MSSTTIITPNLTTNNLISYNNNTTIKWTNLQNNSLYVKLINTNNEYTFTPSEDIHCSLAIIGGGGAGNLMKGGGGGAGGAYISEDNSFIFRNGYNYKLKIGKAGKMIIDNNVSIEEPESGLIVKKYNFKITNNVDFNKSNSNSDKIISTSANIINFNNIESATNKLISADSNGYFNENTNTYEWLGYFHVPSGLDGEYQFKLNSSDSSYLWMDIDGTINTISNPTQTNSICSTTSGSLVTTNTSGNLRIETNIYYPVRIIYGENQSNNYYPVAENSENSIPIVVGGTINNISGSNDSYVIFTSTSGTNTITFNFDTICQVLLVGGGGSGGSGGNNAVGGGGGGGDFITSNLTLKAGTYNITVGNGGIINNIQSVGINGSNSSLIGNGIALYAAGGGCGGYYANNNGNGNSGNTINNKSCGSGGGSSGIISGLGGISICNTNFNGGSGSGGAGGGGGGKSQIGQDSFNRNGGQGGNGQQSLITGSSILYSCGGGGAGISGGNSTNNGKGGSLNQSSSNANSNSGGGGGGGYINSKGGDGGSGVVIIRYTKVNTQASEQQLKINLNFNLSFKGPGTNNEFISDFTNYFYASKPIYSYKYIQSSESYLKEYDINNILTNQIICYGGNNGNLSNTCLNIKPWAMYFAEDWNNNILKDSSGNNRNASTIGNIMKDSTTNKKFTFITGDATSVINFPQGSIPLNYTICSFLRGKNLQGSNGTSWNINLINDWNKIVIKNDNIIINGNIISNDNHNNSVDSLIINNGNWSLSFVIIWDTILTDTQISYLNNCMNDYLNGIQIKNNFINNYENKGGDSGYVTSTFNLPTALITTTINKGGDGNISTNNDILNYDINATNIYKNIVNVKQADTLKIHYIDSDIPDIAYTSGSEPSSQLEIISNDSLTSAGTIENELKCDRNDFVSSVQLYTDNNNFIFNSGISNDLYYTGIGLTCGNGKNLTPYGSTKKFNNIINGLSLKVYSKNDFIDINNFFNNPPISSKIVAQKNGITDFSNITNAINNTITNNFNNYVYLWEGYIIVKKTGNYTFKLQSKDVLSYLWILESENLPTSNNIFITDGPDKYSLNAPVCNPYQNCYEDSWTGNVNYDWLNDRWTYRAGFYIPQRCASFMQGKKFKVKYQSINKNTGEIIHNFEGIYENNNNGTQLLTYTETGSDKNIRLDIYNAFTNWGDGFNFYYFNNASVNVSCDVTISGTTCVNVPNCAAATTSWINAEGTSKQLTANIKYSIKLLRKSFTDLNTTIFSLLGPLKDNIYIINSSESNSSSSISINVTDSFSFGKNNSGFLSKLGNLKTLQCSAGKKIVGFNVAKGGNNIFDNDILTDNISLLCDYKYEIETVKHDDIINTYEQVSRHNVSNFNCISSIGGGGGGAGIIINGYDYDPNTLKGGKGGDGFKINFDPDKNIYGLGGYGSSFTGINEKKRPIFLISNTGCGSDGRNNDINNNSSGSDGIIIINVKQELITNFNVYNTNKDVLNEIYQNLLKDNNNLYNFINHNTNDKILKYINDSFITSYGDSFQSINSLASIDNNIQRFKNIIKMISNIYFNIYNLLLEVSIYNEISFNQIILSNTEISKIDQNNKIIYININSIKPISSFIIPFLDDGNLNIDRINNNLPIILNKTDFTLPINTDYTDYNSSEKKFIINNFYNIFHMNSKNIISEIYYYYAFYNVIWFNIQFINSIYPNMNNNDLDSLNSLIQDYTDNVLNKSTDLDIATLNQIKTNSIINNEKNVKLTAKINKENIQAKLQIRDYNNYYNINSIFQNKLLITTIIFTIIFTILKIILALNFNTIEKIYGLIILLILVILVTIYIYYYVKNGIVENFSVDYNITTINNYFQLVNLYLNNVIIKLPAINNKKYILDSYNTVNNNNEKNMQKLNEDNIKVKSYQSSKNIMKLDNNSHIYFLIYDNYVIILGIIFTIIYLLYPKMLYYLLIIYIIIAIIIYFIYYYKISQYTRTNISKKYYKS